MKMAEKKMDGCDGAGDQSRKVPIRSPAAAAAIETTPGIIKRSPPRKINPSHEEDDKETCVDTKRSKIPDEAADQAINTIITIREGNPSNGHTQEKEKGEGEGRKFHPRVYKGIMFGPSFLFLKKLRSWDVAIDQNRLVITGGYNCLVRFLLRAEERREVYDEFLPVVTTDRNGVEYTLGLKWLRRGGLALINEWSKLVRSNGLKEGDLIKVYRYRGRPHEQLRFALHVIPKK